VNLGTTEYDRAGDLIEVVETNFPQMVPQIDSQWARCR
jgi:hypothetical protein